MNLGRRSTTSSGNFALAQKSKAGDQVVILLGGHGSQQPEQDPPDPKYPKPNGRDQIFLPADIGQWDGGKQHKVTGSIPDFELRRWCKAITKRGTGAALWLIVDSCCSGATLRGGEEVPRKIEPEDLGIPAREFAASAERANSAAELAAGPIPKFFFNSMSSRRILSRSMPPAPMSRPSNDRCRSTATRPSRMDC